MSQSAMVTEQVCLQQLFELSETVTLSYLRRFFVYCICCCCEFIAIVIYWICKRCRQ